MIDIYKYSNYRLYLKDLEIYWREHQNGFSFRNFAKKAGFASPNFFKLVCDGKRNLSPEGALKIANAIGLKKQERIFFFKLVELGQSKTSEDKINATQEILKDKEFLKVHPLKSEEFELYNQWFNIPLREALNIQTWSQDAKKLSKMFLTKVSAGHIAESLEHFKKLGLIKKNSKGLLEPTHKTISTGDLISNASLISFHRQMLDLAKDALDRFRGSEREISAATIAVSYKNKEKIREILKEAKKEILNLAEHDSSPETIMQVNFQMFPLMKEDPK